MEDIYQWAVAHREFVVEEDALIVLREDVLVVVVVVKRLGMRDF